MSINLEVLIEMLTQSQRNALFTNLTKSYTVDGNDYDAVVTYPHHWSGKIDTPVILINYISDPVLKQGTVGMSAEWDVAELSVDVFAHTDYTNNVHGIKIARHIARELILWFKQSADALLVDNGLKIMNPRPARDLSNLEEGVNRMRFEVPVLYKLI